jgi:type IV secretion system protein VirB6
MENFNISMLLLDKLNEASQLFMTDTLANVISAVKPVANTLILIYLGWFGWRLMFGLVDIKNVAVQVFKACVVYSIATQPSLYNQFFGDWLWKLPEALAGLVLNGQTTDTGSFLDGLLNQFYEVRTALSDFAHKDSTMGIPNLEFMFAGWLVLGGGIVLVMFALLIVVMSKMAIAILLSVAPIFIILITFDSTRKFFDAWIGQILSFSFNVMLLAGVLKLIISLLKSYLTTLSPLITQAENPSIAAIVPILIFCGIAILVLLQISAIGSALGGGIALSTLGSFGKAADSARGATLGAGKGAYKGGSWGYNKYKNRDKNNSIENDKD